MTTSVNLFYEYCYRGPGKVISNLIKGLEELQITCISNSHDPVGYCGLLQTISGVHDKNLCSSLCGPNLFVLPSEWGTNSKKYKHFIVPSQWVHDLYRRFSELDHATIDVWAVGIDVNFWKKDITNTQNRCLVYFKSRADDELSWVLNKLNSMKIDYEVFKYGHYTDLELKDACNRCNFSILLTGTESQGIGYMEMLSMGLPSYVINKCVWDDNPNHKVSATSVPYFDDTCGVITNEFNLDRLDEFVQSLNNYQPRKFICDNFALSHKSKDYYQLLEKHNCIRGL